jgi:predicted RNA-binding protein YlxR (DUF448 family)
MPMQPHAIAEIETDAGPRRAGPERLCVATRRVRPVSEMIRFVSGPAGIVPDVKHRLPGRGVWVTAHRGAIADAVKSGAFRRSLKANVSVPPDLADLTERLLLRAALDALSIAYKAGSVVGGFMKVEAALTGGPVVALIHAAEASPDGIRKLAAAYARAHPDVAENLPVVRTLTLAQLDLALARPNMVHAALLAGRASETFLARWRELERFQAPKFADQAGEAAGGPDTATPEPGPE